MSSAFSEKWVENHEIKAENKGRPVKIYRLSNPFSDIVDVIAREKREQAATQLSLIQEIRTYIQ